VEHESIRAVCCDLSVLRRRKGRRRFGTTGSALPESRGSQAPKRQPDGFIATRFATGGWPMTNVSAEPKAIYWHRELPPLDAQPMGEHVVEASSNRVLDTIAHRDELWNRCEGELMAGARARLLEEIARLGGRYAHVLSESIEARHDAAAAEVWLHGCFSYMLYR